MPPEPMAAPATVVTTFLSGVERRLQLVDAVRALTAGSAAAASAIAASAALGYRSSFVWFGIAAVGIVGAAAVLWRARHRWDAGAVASLVEQRVPESYNVVFTAREVLTGAAGTAPWMQRRVVERAASILERASLPAIVPVGREVVWMAVAAGALGAIALVMPQRILRTASRADSTGTHASADDRAVRLRMTATVSAPSYTGIAARTISDPEALDVIQGGRIDLEIGGASAWSVRFGPRALPSTQGTVEIAPEESGYFAIERTGGGDRRLVPVMVTPDRVPVVRVESPGRDMLLPAARGEIAVNVSASDDFGLAALELRYTKVSGSGEQFEFVEGSIPLSISRDGARAWKGAGSFQLGRLGLEPGDSLVYRAVARDGRPGSAGLATSDTFFVEIAGPGQIALPGFELPPDRERYALSQQLIVLKLQRLRARESSMSRDAISEEVTTLAAEQRAIRANFIFLMGGQVEDEEQEARQSSEIQEGRLENTARREISHAIEFMGQAEQALVAADTGAALPPAKSAVDALQRAFGHNRYFLRTLAVRSRVDPSRRLTGDLKEATGWNRLAEAATGDPKTAKARSLLVRIMALVGESGTPPAPASAAAGALAEEALAVDPGSTDWRRISSELTKLRDTLARGGTWEQIRQSVGEAVRPLVAISRKNAVRAGETAADQDRLRSAWADEARRR